METGCPEGQRCISGTAKPENCGLQLPLGVGWCRNGSHSDKAGGDGMEGEEGQGQSKFCVCMVQEGLDGAVVFCSASQKVNFIDSEGKSSRMRAQASWETQEKSKGVNNEPR